MELIVDVETNKIDGRAFFAVHKERNYEAVNVIIHDNVGIRPDDVFAFAKSGDDVFVG